MDWSAVDYCDVFIRLSFWRHPFTAEHPLLRHWCRDTFLQTWWRHKLILISDDLRVNTFYFEVNYFFKWLLIKKYVFLFRSNNLNHILFLTIRLSNITVMLYFHYSILIFSYSIRSESQCHFISVSFAGGRSHIWCL